MRWLDALPLQPAGPGGQVIVLEAEPGRRRREAVGEWLSQARARGATAWLLECNLDEHGIWAGLNGWLEDLLPRVERDAADLVRHHDRELAAVLPARRRQAPAEQATLTDSAVGDEAVRNYALNRAYRIGQGLVDFLDAWHRRSGGGEWVVACEDFDRSGALVRRFFRELVRRRGGSLRLTLLLCVPAGAAEAAAAGIDAGTPVSGVRLAFPPEPRPVPSRAEMTERARELERRIGEDLLEAEIHLPELIRYWTLSEHPERARRWQALALGLYNHYGFYEDALAYSEAVLASLDYLSVEDGYFTRWNLVGSLFGALVATGQVDRAHRIVRDEAWAKIENPADRARICYVMAMLHARFLPQRDLEAAESYLQEGLREIARAGMPESEEHFLSVFLMNGLALVRHRQGNSREAIDITHSGFQRLNERLHPGQHRLHRSVLLYNLAQVYVATGEHAKAIESFTGAMAMDPNYSEYYNERGNVYLKMGRFQEAVRDYREAVRLSSPYPEVWTNLGQCYRQMGLPEEAVQAYSVALDLDPARQLARLGRAQMLEATGRVEEAIADYDVVLSSRPDQPLVLANRAALLYRAGRLAESLADLDRAIGLSPDTADLYRNRAVALADLGRPEEAADDLETVLLLEPAAPDRAELAERISRLRPVVPAA